MFGFGFGEILVLAAIGLIVLGPKQMTQLARVLGRTVAELRKSMNEFTAKVVVDLDETEKKQSQPPPPDNSVTKKDPP